MNDGRKGPALGGAGAMGGGVINPSAKGVPPAATNGTKRMNLNDALDSMVTSKSVGQWMTIADEYLSAPFGAPGADALPKTHRLLAPVIERCRGDERAFLRLLEALRATHQGAEDVQLGVLIGKVCERVAQAEKKRTRSRRAAAILIRASSSGVRRPLRTSVVEPTARQIEQVWEGAVIQTLRVMCDVHPRHELDLREFEQLHNEFWGFVEEEVTNGRVPLWGGQINVPREHP